MQRIEPPDTHHVNASMGWLELGNAREAVEELKQVSKAAENAPEVMDAWWMIHAHLKDWEAALEVARRYVKTYPEDASGWIHQSYGLHEMKRTREAWDLLLSVAEKFSDVGLIPYNLACYACQLGELDVAIVWLRKAMELDGEAEVKKRAANDSDLLPLLRVIEKM